MAVKILDGKKLSAKILENLKQEIQELKIRYKRAPHLAVILVGNNPASQVYVNIKNKRSQEIGMEFSLYRFPDNITERKIKKTINKLNKDKKIDGIIVQLPLPEHLDERKILDEIAIEKDVDGLTTQNLGALFSGHPYFIPCTPAGIIELIKNSRKNINGKRAVIIGRSNIVGKPISILLLKENCTVTICHSKTRNLAKEIKQADILIAAIGRAEFIKGSWIKKGAIVIDVGINRIEDKSSAKGYKIVGDINFKQASRYASFITPVPGGVGPMTVTMLLKNTVDSFKRKFI